MTEQTSITVLTLNVWGAPYAKSRPARMQAIAEKLRLMQPDIIALQECYLAADRNIIIEALNVAGWQRHYFASGLIGSGLLTFSRYPIIKAAFHRFRMGGKPERLQHGDFYAGKGIGLLRVKTPDSEIDVYNIHPHAQYYPQDDNEYAIYTSSNLYEAANFVNAHSDTNPVVLCGDYNVRPDQSGYRLIHMLANLRDTFHDQHPENPGITFSPDNPYVSSNSQRLDYIMHRHLTIHSVEIVFDDKPDNLPAYSDHYGIMTTASFSDVTEHSHVDPVATQEVLLTLQKQVKDTYSETLLLKNTYTDRALFSAASMGDLFIFRRLLKRLPAGHLISRTLFITMILFSLYHLLQAELNLRSRQQTLEALLDELSIQLVNHHKTK